MCCAFRAININNIRQKKTLHFIFSQVKNINIIIKILLSQKQTPSYCLPLHRNQPTDTKTSQLEGQYWLDNKAVSVEAGVVMSEQSVMTYCRLVVVCSQPVCCCHQWLMMLPAFHNYVIHHFLAPTGTNTPASRHTLISGPLSKQLRIKTFINFLFYLEGIFAVIVGIWLMLTIQTLRCSLLTERGHIPSCNLTITDKYYLLLDYRLAKL